MTYVPPSGMIFYTSIPRKRKAPLNLMDPPSLKFEDPKKILPPLRRGGAETMVLILNSLNFTCINLKLKVIAGMEKDDEN